MFVSFNARLFVIAFVVAVFPGFTLAIDDPIPEPIPEGSVQVKLEIVATGLAAPNWGISAPGLPARILFVTDQNGILWEIDTVTGLKRTFLDVSDGLVGLEPFDERGLLGVAFHPDYGTNGLLYIYASVPVDGEADFSTMPQGVLPDHQSLIVEWQVPDPTNLASVVDPGSARVLLRIDQPQSNHNGGGLNFGPDGMLYISLGDGGGVEDQGIGHTGPRGNGQNPTNVLGTILRIDPTGSNSANGKYGIPADNPFAAISRLVPEIYAFGFRNPFRFSFDAVSGTLVVGDVGQSDIEEIDIVLPGLDYGWNFKEGTFCFNPNGNDPGTISECLPNQVPAFLIDPVAQYDHDEGSAILGGFVYRGTDIPALAGHYVFGDYSAGFLMGGRLFYLEGEQIFELQLVGEDELDLFVLGFGQDGFGELYVLANNSFIPSGESGVVLRIAPPDSPSVVHSHIVGFTLEDLVISAGTTVEWHNHDSAVHTSTSGVSPDPDGIWNSGFLSQDQTSSHTFNETGSFEYFCTVHSFMTGTVTVVAP